MTKSDFLSVGLKGCWHENGQNSYEVNFNEEGPAKYWNSKGEEVESEEEAEK